MSKFKKEKVLPRYLLVAVLLSIVGVAVVVKAGYTMTADRDYWLAVQKNQINQADSLKKPNRGNVLSCDGQLLAGSIPEYEIFIDFRAGYNKKEKEDLRSETNSAIRKRFELLNKKKRKSYKKQKKRQEEKRKD